MMAERCTEMATETNTVTKMVTEGDGDEDEHNGGDVKRVEVESSPPHCRRHARN